MKHVKNYFLLFLSLLCCMPSMLAQQTDAFEGYYRIRTDLVPAFIRDNGGQVTTRSNGADTNATTGEVGDLNEMWRIQRQSNGGYIITNVATGKAVIAPAHLNQAYSTGVTGTIFYIKTVNTDLRVISSQADFQGQTCWHRNNNRDMVRWSDSDKSRWRFFPVTDQTELIAVNNAPSMLAVAGQLGNHRVFSIKNRNNQYLSQGSNNSVVITRTPQNTSKSHLWIVDNIGGKYVIRNAQSLQILNLTGNAVALSNTVSSLYIKQSKAHSSYVTIGANAVFSNGRCLAVGGRNRIILGNASTSALTNSDWILERSNVEFNDIMNAAFASQGRVYAPVSGGYYRIVNKAYTDKSMTGFVGGEALEGATSVENNYGQIWQLQSNGTSWTFKNVLTEQYVQNNAGRSGDFTMGANASNFSLARPNEFTPAIAFQGAEYAMHCAQSQGSRVVGWYADADASQWYLQRVEMTSAMQQSVQQLRSAVTDVVTNRATYNEKLLNFFTDASCSVLKSNYISMSETDFRNALQAQNLPAPLVEMAMRVKKNTWNAANATANRLEQDFRITTYAPHSNDALWSRKLGMSFPFSRLTNPTGITGELGNVIYIFVEQIPENCSVKAELVEGFNPTGKQYTLHQGVNAILMTQKAHIYLYYTIDDVNIKLAERPAIKVHIEGGRANGYFDVARHTNDDWRTMRGLESQGFFQDMELRMKARNHTTYVMHRTTYTNHHNHQANGLYQMDDSGEWSYNNVYYGIVGLLNKHEEHVQWQHELSGLSEYTEYFNCRFVAMSSSTSYPHATSYGTYYPGVGTYMSYAKFVKGWENDEGEPIWVWAHENGHLFQGPVNFAGMTEVSVNLFSQMSAWRRGSSVTRGVPLKEAIGKFHQKAFYADYGGSALMRMYWQLYLYYDVLGNRRGFFPEVFKRLREDKLVRSGNAGRPGSGATDYLKFARVCSDVAQEDLTEFFEFYGFFIPVENRMVDDYSKSYFTTTQQDIDATKNHMAQYQVKRKNLIFIDDRIELTPATYQGAPAGTMRHACSAAATPGVAGEVGDVGMYTLFAPNAAQATVAAVKKNGRIFQMTTSNAVGYKVYNAENQLVFVSNENTFTLPETIDVNRVSVKVGSGNGDEIEVVRNGQVLTQYNNATANYTYRHGLDVSPNVNSIVSRYKIYNSAVPANYLAATTASTGVANAGNFAIIAGTIGEAVYIYNIDQRKWVSYTDWNDGANKAILVNSQAEAKMWKIEPEDAAKTRFDVYPYNAQTGTYGTRAWNWHGGASSTNRMGFYDANDNNSTWTFVSEQSTLRAQLREAMAAIKRTGVGYPTMTAPSRVALSRKLEVANANPTAQNVQEALAALPAYYAETDIELPQAGKVYRLRNRLDGRFIANVPVMEGATMRTLSMSTAKDNSTLWVCRQEGGVNRLINKVGDKYMARQGGISRGSTTETKDNTTNIVFGRGTAFGTLYVRVNGFSLAGVLNAMHVDGSSTHNSYAATNWTTDFYFDEVTDYNFDATRAYSIDFEDAGIETSQPQNEVIDNSAVYDLSGRRVEVLQRGKMYVRNGRVFIAK